MSKHPTSLRLSPTEYIPSHESIHPYYQSCSPNNTVGTPYLTSRTCVSRFSLWRSQYGISTMDSYSSYATYDWCDLVHSLTMSLHSDAHYYTHNQCVFLYIPINSHSRCPLFFMHSRWIHSSDRSQSERIPYPCREPEWTNNDQSIGPSPGGIYGIFFRRTLYRGDKIGRIYSKLCASCSSIYCSTTNRTTLSNIY